MLAVALGRILSGCGGDEDPRSRGTEPAPQPLAGSPSPEVVDDRGHRVSPLRPPRRVVSAVPSLTELIVAIGAGDRLVSRTRYDRDPSLAHLPSLGDMDRPNLEAIVGLAPDLVVTWADEEHAPLSERMRALGIPVYHASVQRLDDVARHAMLLGTLLGQEAAAEGLVQEIREGLRAVEAGAPETPRSVLYLVWHDPPRTAGPGTFLQEIIELAGGRNLFEDAGAAWPVVSLEEILRRDPDVLVVAFPHAERAGEPAWLRRPGWRELPAVREGRMLIVDPDLFNRPGPRVVDAARELSAFLAKIGRER